MTETHLIDAVNILIVDDSPHNLVALKAVLEDSMNYHVVAASSGREAIERVKQMDFALVLLDVQMPDLDGYQTAEEIKKLERGKNIPIMMVTAIFREDPHILKGYQVGAIDYIGKPFDPDILRAKVAVYANLYMTSHQLEVLRSEQRFRALVERSSDGIMVIDAETRIQYVSPTISHLLGYSENEFTGRFARDFVHPEDDAAAMKAFAELLATPGKVDTIVNRVRHKDGSWRWIESTSSNLLDQPNVRGVVVNFRDVTERKKSADALRESQEQLRFAAQTAGFGTYMLDFVAKESWWSPELKRLASLPAESETPLNGVMNFVHPDDRSRVAPKMESSLDPTGLGEFTDEHRWLFSDGSVRWVLVKGKTFFEGDGNARRPTRATGIVIDITKHKQAPK